MRTKKSLKVLLLALAVVMVFGVVTTAFAYDQNLSNKLVRGGQSQTLAYGTRNEPNYAEFTLHRAYATGNPGTWKMRAYDASGTATISGLYDIIGGGLHKIYYSSHPSWVTMKNSVTSGYASDYYTFDAHLKM